MDQAILKSLLIYSPETGEFNWINFQNGANTVGPAGCINNIGYVVIRVLKKLYLAHRLAWLYMTGEWPPNLIDHINRDRSDNRWSNLRLSNKSLNSQNTSKKVKNYWFSKKENKYVVEFKLLGKKITVGRYKTEQEAQNCAAHYKQQIHPFYAMD